MATYTLPFHHSANVHTDDVLRGRTWWTVAEVAERLNESAEKVREFINAGELPASRRGSGGRQAREWRIHRDHLAAFEHQQLRAAEAEAEAARSRKAEREGKGVVSLPEKPPKPERVLDY